MGKLKTHKTTAKRFRITKTGKLIHAAKGWNHLRSKKDARYKYRARLSRTLSKANVKSIKRVLPGVGNA